MASIKTMVDLGCGNGEDLQWWATRTSRDDMPEPLNINCVGVDVLKSLTMAKDYVNMTYQCTDFEEVIHPPKQLFDVLWCFNSFQYCINPLQTLVKWRDITSPGGMLVISVPQTMNFRQRVEDIVMFSQSYYHYSLVNLMYMLAVTGWDCRSGFFKKNYNDPWIHAVVYRGDDKKPLDPKKTTWYDLAEQERLLESADQSIHAHGYLRQQDLILPWLDQSLTYMGKK
jgi:SAM-dependent methyltransferase